MRVRIIQRENEIDVQVLDEGGGAMHSSKRARLIPGDVWRGWKYSRLAKLGSGEHYLLTKAEKELLKGMK